MLLKPVPSNKAVAGGLPSASCGRGIKVSLSVFLLVSSLVYLVVYTRYLEHDRHRRPHVHQSGSGSWEAEITTDFMPLPGISVCNQNEVRVTRFTERDLDNLGDWFFGITEDGDLPAAAVERLPEHVVQYIRGTLGNSSGGEGDAAADSYDISEFMRRVGHQEEGVVSRCWWTGKPCAELNITWTQTLAYPYGNCYTINLSAANADQLRFDSVGNVLKIHFKAEVSERNEYSRPGVAGPVIQLHAPGDIPYFHDVYGKASETFAVGDISQVKVEKVSEIRRQSQSAGEVSMNRCRMRCESGEFLRDMGCLYYDHPGVRSNPGVPMCKVTPYINDVVKRIISHCHQQCRHHPGPPSVEVMYDYRVEHIRHNYDILDEHELTIINVSPAQDPPMYEVWRQRGHLHHVLTGILYWMAAILASVTISLLILTTCFTYTYRDEQYKSVTTA